jgi:histidine ammonia-lyase
MKIDDIYEVLFHNRKITISDDDRNKIIACYNFLEEFKKDKVIYGINTGFGPMAQYRVSDDDLLSLQYNIIRSHSAGAGEPMPSIAVKAAMVSRLMTFLQLRSGVHIDVVDMLTTFINNDIIPFIPQHGSVGASGDLVQLAHIALTLIGEGQVKYNYEWRPTIDVMNELGIEPLTIHGRDGLSLVNGTAMMTGLGLVNLIYAKNAFNWAIKLSVMMNEVAGSYDDFLSVELNSVRRQKGQQVVVEMMNKLAANSRCMRKRSDELYSHKHEEEQFEHKVQPYYSLRCVPQILGPIWEVIENCERVLINEVNSADDNPIVDPETKNIYHGGNFHGDYISFEMDKLKIAVTKLTMLVERQLNYLYHDRINGILPPFVNMGKFGLNYGMQACQFTATSTTAECQTLSNPMYVHSIPNNNDNQDIVSMGTNSALLAERVINNSYQVLSIHAMSVMQAVDCLGIKDKLSSATRAIYDEVRSFFPAFCDDSVKYEDIACTEDYLRSKVTDR